MSKRVIKFRAWYKEIGEEEMYYNAQNTYDWHEYREGNGCPATYFGEILDSDDYIVMEYTGLNDINDKDIYEGDILKIRDPINHSYIKRTVEYHNCEFKVKWNTELWVIANRSEVIGNIYENSELLKEV